MWRARRKVGMYGAKGGGFTLRLAIAPHDGSSPSQQFVTTRAPGNLATEYRPATFIACVFRGHVVSPCYGIYDSKWRANNRPLILLSFFRVVSMYLTLHNGIVCAINGLPL